MLDTQLTIRTSAGVVTRRLSEVAAEQQERRRCRGEVVKMDEAATCDKCGADMEAGTLAVHFPYYDKLACATCAGLDTIYNAAMALAGGR